MIKCVIIDDEQPAINVLKKYISRLPNLELIGAYTNPLLGMEVIKKEKPDVVFLDIQMDELDGIEVMKVIGNISNVIFCTAYSEFAVTSYELEAVDYLMKPIEFSRFVKAVQRLSDIMAHQPTSNAEAIPNDYIFVKAGQRGKMLKIDLDDIDFVEGMNNYVAFHRGTQKTLAYLTLKELEERLPGSDFMRVHKSYIVALKQISLMENNELEKSMQYVMKLPSPWDSSNYREKRILQFKIFPDGFYYNKKKDENRTTKMNSVFALIARLKGVSEESKTGTSEIKLKNSGLVASTGIEPVSKV